MKKELGLSRFGWLRAAVVSAVIIGLIGFAGNGAAFARNAHKGFPENESGLTYGTIPEAEEVGESLDLVEVQATNGLIGYVYNDELLAAEGVGSVGHRGLNWSSTEMAQRSDEALADQLTQLLSEDVAVTAEDAELYLNVAIREGLEEPTVECEMEHKSQAIACLAEGIGVSEEAIEDVIDEAVLAAQDQVSVHIPVYGPDGKTQIGEFAIGSLI